MPHRAMEVGSGTGCCAEGWAQMNATEVAHRARGGPIIVLATAQQYFRHQGGSRDNCVAAFVKPVRRTIADRNVVSAADTEETQQTRRIKSSTVPLGIRCFPIARSIAVTCCGHGCIYQNPWSIGKT
jgi:hypothetical protein